jgi:CRP/FNR family transcriptional regulator
MAYVQTDPVGVGQHTSNLGALAKTNDKRISLRPPEHIRVGQILFCEGDRGADAFQIISGTICFYRVLLDGRRLVCGFALAGEIFSLSHNGLHLYSAEAVSDCHFRRLSHRQSLDLADGEAVLRRKITAYLRNEPWVLQSEMLRLLHMHADESIAYFILDIGRRLNPDLTDGCRIRLDMSRIDIADFLGLTVETVCRALKRLTKSGFLSAVEPHEFIVRDINALRKLAGGKARD